MEIIKTMTYSDYLNTDYKSCAIYENVIRIPNFYDGLKISQRKIIHSILKHGNSGTIKVEQLANFTAGYTDYKHGASNLNGVIIGMAKNFKGTNNYNLLYPEGSFGIAISPDAASPRYVYTRLDENFRKFFNDDDMDLCKYAKDDDGNDIEPLFYIPIIPTIFLNPSSGLGNGFSSLIFPRNIKDMVEYIIDVLKNEVSDKLIKLYYGDYTGNYSIDDKTGKVKVVGTFEINRRTVTITETPFLDLEKMRAIINKLIDKKIVQDFVDSSAGNDFNISCKMMPDVILTDENIIKWFKLEYNDVENITLWKDNQIVKFDSVYDVIKSFIPIRLNYYEQRIQNNINKLLTKLNKLVNMLKFATYSIDNITNISKMNKVELISFVTSELQINEPNDVINLPIHNLTIDNINKFKNDILQTQDQINKLKQTSPKDMYINELESIYSSL